MRQSEISALLPDTKRKVTELKSEYLQGNITYDALKEALFDLMVLDESNTWWMVGYNTLQWYFYDPVGKEWVRDTATIYQ